MQKQTPLTYTNLNQQPRKSGSSGSGAWFAVGIFTLAVVVGLIIGYLVRLNRSFPTEVVVIAGGQKSASTSSMNKDLGGMDISSLLTNPLMQKAVLWYMQSKPSSDKKEGSSSLTSFLGKLLGGEPAPKEEKDKSLLEKFITGR